MNYPYTFSGLNQTAIRRLRDEKIAHYMLREPKYFLQLDGVFYPKHDIQTEVDFQCDFLSAKRTVELMHGSTVRVLIPETTPLKIAVRQLKKLTKLLIAKPELLDYAIPDEKDRQVFIDDDLPF